MSNFNEITKNIFNLYSNIKSLLLIENLNINNINEDNLKETYKLLNKLNQSLIPIENNEILLQGIKDRYYIQLREIKYFLKETKNIKGRSYHNKIFTKIFKMEKYIPLGITIVFEEFIKGITYFNDEMENKKKIPIYHRMASCGNSSENFIKKYLQCYNNNIEEDKDIKKTHIFKCYLERLIYDNMYKELTLHFPKTINNEHKQNNGHVYQLSKRAKNFNKCFLGLEINIQIYYENNFPIYLIVEYYEKKQKIKEEKYLKTTYIDEYGNTRYSDYVYYTLIENNIEQNSIRQF